MDDITQQGFSSQCYRGAGISMEPHSPFPAHRFVLLPDPNLLKGPSEWRNRAVEQALGINLAWVLVLYHPYSSPRPPSCPPLLGCGFQTETSSQLESKFKYYCHQKQEIITKILCSAAEWAERNLFLFLLLPDCVCFIKAGSKRSVLPFIVWLLVCTIQWPLLQISPDTSNKDEKHYTCTVRAFWFTHSGVSKTTLAAFIFSFHHSVFKTIGKVWMPHHSFIFLFFHFTVSVQWKERLQKHSKWTFSESVLLFYTFFIFIFMFALNVM